MPPLRPYALFISHAWRHDDDYARLVDFLDRAPYFKWKNYSVPQHDPLIDPDKPAGKKRLLQELADQIRPVHCVLVLAGMYVAYSKWIQAEIDLAKNMQKPIIGVKPRGQQQTPRAVFDAAQEMVGWQTDSIVDAIRRHAQRKD